LVFCTEKNLATLPPRPMASRSILNVMSRDTPRPQPKKSMTSTLSAIWGAELTALLRPYFKLHRVENRWKIERVIFYRGRGLLLNKIQRQTFSFI
jgi:hypothetical protein